MWHIRGLWLLTHDTIHSLYISYSHPRQWHGSAAHSIWDEFSQFKEVQAQVERTVIKTWNPHKSQWHPDSVVLFLS